jgi:hypothetical protein
VIDGLMTYKNGMVVKAEMRQGLFEKVAGQHTATTEALFLGGSTTERDFGRKIHHLPSEMNGQVLCQGTAFLPVARKYEMLRIKMVYEKKNIWNFLPVQQEDIQLLDENAESYAGGAFFRRFKLGVGRGQVVVLFDHENQAMALIKKKNNKFMIFGTRPLVDGNDNEYAEPQMEVLSPSQLANFPVTKILLNPILPKEVVAFYPWFCLLTQSTSDGPIAFVSVLADTAPDSSAKQPAFEPLYKIIPKEGGSHGKKKKVFCVYDYFNDERIAVVSNECCKGQMTNQVDVAPGVDPAMGLCIAACLDEMGML